MGPMAEPVKEDVHLQSCSRGSTFVQIFVEFLCSQSQIMGLPGLGLESSQPFCVLGGHEKPPRDMFGNLKS